MRGTCLGGHFFPERRIVGSQQVHTIDEGGHGNDDLGTGLLRQVVEQPRVHGGEPVGANGRHDREPQVLPRVELLDVATIGLVGSERQLLGREPSQEVPPLVELGLVETERSEQRYTLLRHSQQ